MVSRGLADKNDDRSCKDIRTLVATAATTCRRGSVVRARRKETFSDCAKRVLRLSSRSTVNRARWYDVVQEESMRGSRSAVLVAFVAAVLSSFSAAPALGADVVKR